MSAWSGPTRSRYSVEELRGLSTHVLRALLRDRMSAIEEAQNELDEAEARKRVACADASAVNAEISRRRNGVETCSTG